MNAKGALLYAMPVLAERVALAQRTPSQLASQLIKLVSENRQNWSSSCTRRVPLSLRSDWNVIPS